MHHICNSDELSPRVSHHQLRNTHNRFGGEFGRARHRGESRHSRNMALEQALLHELRDYFNPRGKAVDTEEGDDQFPWAGSDLHSYRRYDALHLAELQGEALAMARHYGGSATELRDADGNVTHLTFDRNGRVRHGTTDDGYASRGSSYFDPWSVQAYDDELGYYEHDRFDDCRLDADGDGLDYEPEDDEPVEESLFESESRRFDYSIVYTHDNWY